jgi:PAS domain-containing protein
MNRPTVLILASDPAFAREITVNWPEDAALDGNGPEFTVLDEGFCGGLEGSYYDLAIADASAAGNDGNKKKEKHKLLAERLNRDSLKHNERNQEPPNQDLKHLLSATGKPAIVIDSEGTRNFYQIHGAVIALRREPGLWPVLAGIIGREILRRTQAEARARESDRICAAALAEATLGRFMVEMRTNINNALTTVLGNAELLAHEPGLPASTQAQADAIRSMALRLHEVFQRFSSIEKELSVAAREPGKRAAHAAAGCCC